MPLVLADRVKENSSTTGTGTFTLTGAQLGFQSFAVVGNANTTYYTIQNPGTSEWEVGIGTYTSANTTIARTTILASSNSNSVVSFSAGTKDVFVTYPAQYSVVLNNAQTFTAAQTFRAANAIRSEAASTQDAVVIAGRAGGTSSYAVTLTPATLSANRTVTIADGGGNYTIGYRNIPAVGTQTGSYTLATTDIGKYVQVGTGGSITIPDATFAEGDVISIFNNTTGNITLNCAITTAYIAGTDADKATMTLVTRGVATVLFISSTVCVVSGSVL